MLAWGLSMSVVGAAASWLFFGLLWRPEIRMETQLIPKNASHVGYRLSQESTNKRLFEFGNPANGDGPAARERSAMPLHSQLLSHKSEVSVSAKDGAYIHATLQRNQY
jgi:hypothetical protein